MSSANELSNYTQHHGFIQLRGFRFSGQETTRDFLSILPGILFDDENKPYRIVDGTRKAHLVNGYWYFWNKDNVIRCYEDITIGEYVSQIHLEVPKANCCRMMYSRYKKAANSHCIKIPDDNESLLGRLLCDRFSGKSNDSIYLLITETMCKFVKNTQIITPDYVTDPMRTFSVYEYNNVENRIDTISLTIPVASIKCVMEIYKK